MIKDDPRAGTIHPPSLEMFETLGVAETMIERGYIVRNYHYRDRKTGLVANFDLGVLAEDTPFPYRLMLEQHKVSGIVHDALQKHNDFSILRQHTVNNVTQSRDTASGSTPDGPKSIRGRYNWAWRAKPGAEMHGC